MIIRQPQHVALRLATICIIGDLMFNATVPNTPSLLWVRLAPQVRGTLELQAVR